MNLTDFNERTQKQIRPQLSTGHPRPAAIVESNPRHEPLETEEIQGSTGARVLVRVESIRSRLLDEDNLCEKYHVDLLRYAGVIAGDTPDEIKIEVSQRKAQKGEQERIVIEVVDHRTTNVLP